jgi:protein-arginine kinase activator protein McsA
MVNWEETDEDYERGLLESKSNYTINKDKEGKEVSITCHTCEMTSYNPNDIKHKYCGKCHKYHNP